MTAESIVHVIDDDEAVRDSLTFLLQAAGFSPVCYASAQDFLAALDGSTAGCVLTDVRMPNMSGLELIAHLRAGPHAVLPVVVMTGHGDIAMAVDAMKAGASDFLEKPFEDEALIAAIGNALAVKATTERKDAERADAAERLASLSSREREVLDGLAKGRANKVIAQDLGISPRTVEIYRANVMTKMGAGSLSELVRLALIAGAID